MFSGGILCRRTVLSPNHFKILAIVGEVLFGDQVGAPVPALLRYAGIIADAIEADFQVRTAGRAGL
jgi:hypothetical protein